MESKYHLIEEERLSGTEASQTAGGKVVNPDIEAFGNMVVQKLYYEEFRDLWLKYYERIPAV